MVDITGRESVAQAKVQLEAFVGLINRTIEGLQSVTTPSQLSGTIDTVESDWEAADRDFAQVLRDLKGQAWSMQSEHVRAIREKLVEHLQANLNQVRQRIASLGR